ERGNRETRLLCSRRAHDEAFLLQALQRLAHRRATHAEPGRDLRLDDATAGRQRSLDDEIAQSNVDLIRTRAVRRTGERPCSGCGFLRGEMARSPGHSANILIVIPREARDLHLQPPADPSSLRSPG